MEKGDLKDLFKEISTAAMGVNLAKQSLSDHELKIRTTAASLFGYVDKEGKDDPKKVKAGLMKKAIELQLTGDNKLEEDLETMETYHKLMKSGEISTQAVNKYGTLADALKDASSELSSIKKSAGNELDALELAAIFILVKEQIDRMNSGEDGDKEYTVKNEKALYDKVEELKAILS